MRIGVRAGETLPVAPVGEARQPDLAAVGATRRQLVELGAEDEAAEPLERVAPPRAVVDALAHGLAILAVAGDVDAGLLLPPHHLLDRRAQAPLVKGLVGRLTRPAGAVQLDQVVGPWQAPRVTGQHAPLAPTHQLAFG